jgi:hypothetical protein
MITIVCHAKIKVCLLAYEHESACFVMKLVEINKVCYLALDRNYCLTVVGTECVGNLISILGGKVTPISFEPVDRF